MQTLTFQQTATVLGDERTVTISNSHPAADLHGFTEEFIKPLLLAIGYAPENVRELFSEES